VTVRRSRLTREKQLQANVDRRGNLHCAVTPAGVIQDKDPALCLFNRSQLASLEKKGADLLE
jgi:hypothetical protein